ncbi:hypothetical protein [Collinsella sp. D33t1_170424_A12]|uniref:hypothetical protein n=1 Tax=Collinsella sp. D33t1_170424_A12 TaxID=2787135 RepID=UPI001898B612|nr:hypothetical protein [Collinsella sp. D33t1_170424_A12]
MRSLPLLGATATRLVPGEAVPSLLGPLAHARIALPNLGQIAPAINLLIDIALAALLCYILLTSRKGR